VKEKRKKGKKGKREESTGKPSSPWLLSNAHMGRGEFFLSPSNTVGYRTGTGLDRAVLYVSEFMRHSALLFDSEKEKKEKKEKKKDRKTSS